MSAPLFNRTITTPEPAHMPGIGECWQWTGYRDPDGYGTVKHAGRNMLAHRVAWSETNGPVTDGLCVLHRCDNRACVRPDHLFLGTKAENNADMKAKGRGSHPRGDRNGSRTKPESRPRGNTHSSAKLTDADVREIRSRAAAGETQTALGRAFGVSHIAIGFIVRRKTWKHVGDDAVRPGAAA